MANAIMKCEPDIVGLNEMRDGDNPPEFAAQCKILSEKTGLENYCFAKALDLRESAYGNGLLSRFKIVSAEVIDAPDPEPRKYDGYYEHRVLLKAKLENGITVMVIHFGLNPDEARNVVQTVIDNVEDEKCILMGDFNLPPQSPILDPIREKMKDTAHIFRRSLLSFPSYIPREKIDYIFVSRDIEVLDADIPEIVASYHRPHTAQIRIFAV